MVNVFLFLTSPVAWNEEVLWVGGFLERIIYEEEMHIAAKFKDDLATEQGLSTMARFAFGPTSPHSDVSKVLQDAFCCCCNELKAPFPIVSESGISCTSDSQLRRSTDGELSFLRSYQVLHNSIKESQCTRIIERYKTPKFGYEDIIREFQIGVTQDAMKSFFVWWEYVKREPLSSDKARDAREKFCRKIASRGVVRLSHGAEIALKNIKHYTFLSPPNDLSRPDTLHIDVSQGVPTRDTIECFGWVQLSLLDWLEYARAQAQQLISNRGSDKDADAGLRVLHDLVQFALVKDLSGLQWDRVAELVKDLRCIPTNMGLKLPGDSYFEEADVCGSLPVVWEINFLDNVTVPVALDRHFVYRLVDREHIRKVLTRIRVCRMVDWNDMIARYVNLYKLFLLHCDTSYRLESVASEETNGRLLRYLAITYGANLTKEQIYYLTKKKVFYSNDYDRMSTTELYFPNEDMRTLGFPIFTLSVESVVTLQGALDSSGFPAVGPFLEYLGIQRYLTLHNIIVRATSNKQEVQRLALQYLLPNLETRYNTYKPDDFMDIAFILTEGGPLACLNEVA